MYEESCPVLLLVVVVVVVVLYIIIIIVATTTGQWQCIVTKILHTMIVMAFEKADINVNMSIDFILSKKLEENGQFL